MHTTAITATSVEHTAAIAHDLATTLAPGDVIHLVGDLGAGKTTFVRALAQAIGIDPAHVSSPTFAIANLYEGPRPLLHIDAYRLSPSDDPDTVLADVGIERASPPITAVEWPQRLPAGALPPTVTITIEHAGPDRRRITIAR